MKEPLSKKKTYENVDQLKVYQFTISDSVFYMLRHRAFSC